MVKSQREATLIPLRASAGLQALLTSCLLVGISGAAHCQVQSRPCCVCGRWALESSLQTVPGAVRLAPSTPTQMRPQGAAAQSSRLSPPSRGHWAALVPLLRAVSLLTQGAEFQAQNSSCRRRETRHTGPGWLWNIRKKGLILHDHRQKCSVNIAMPPA